MRTHLVFTLLFGAATLPLFVACGGGSGSVAHERDNPIVDNSCDFSFNEGRANAERTSHQDIVQTYFGKRYDRGWLKTLHNTSAHGSFDYITGSLHVPVYRTNTANTGKCQYFAQIPLAPQDLQYKWDTQIISDSALVLSGLYNPSPSPSIIIRADSNKWTLLHEMLHHDFQVQRDREGQISGPDLSARLQRSLNDLDTLEQTRNFNHDIADHYFSILDSVMADLNTGIVNGALEEIAVEIQLRDAYRTREVEFLPNKELSSQEYISESATLARNKYDILLAQFQRSVDFITNLKFAGSTGVAANWKQLIADRQAEINRVADEYGVVAHPTSAQSAGAPPAPSRPNSMDAWSGSSAKLTLHDADCEKNSEFEALFAKFASRPGLR